MDNVPVALEIGGRVIQTRQVTVEPNRSSSTTFEPITVTERNLKATVRLGDDALVRAIACHFGLSAEVRVRVSVAERTGAPRAGRLYLTRALGVGDAPRFDVKVTAADAITSEELARASVVMLNDVPVSQGIAERLLRNT